MQGIECMRFLKCKRVMLFPAVKGEFEQIKGFLVELLIFGSRLEENGDGLLSRIKAIDNPIQLLLFDDCCITTAFDFLSREGVL